MLDLGIEFEFEISGKTDSGEMISKSGRSQIQSDVDPEDMDERTIVSEAIQSAFDHFWTFEIEKGGHHNLRDVTISIGNFQDLNRE